MFIFQTSPEVHAKEKQKETGTVGRLVKVNIAITEKKQPNEGFMVSKKDYEKAYVALIDRKLPNSGSMDEKRMNMDYYFLKEKTTPKGKTESPVTSELKKYYVEMCAKNDQYNAGADFWAMNFLYKDQERSQVLLDIYRFSSKEMVALTKLAWELEKKGGIENLKTDKDLHRVIRDITEPQKWSREDQKDFREEAMPILAKELGQDGAEALAKKLRDKAYS